MSGWDTPSRPTWDPQDGPEDGTQAFSATDTSFGADDPWGAPAGSGWGASSQAADHGAPGFGGGATGGSDFGGPGADDAFSGPPPEFFTQEFEQRTPGATLGRSADRPSWDLPVRDSGGRGRNGAAAQAPTWDAPQWQDAPRQENGRQDEYARQDDYGRQDEYGRRDPARPDLDRPDFGRQDLAPQEFPRRQPGREYAAQLGHGAQSGYATQPGYGAQADQREQAPPAAPRSDRDMAARMDPALQDFFAPTAPGNGYAPRPGQGPQGPQEFRGQQRALPSGLPGPGQQPRLGVGRGPQGPGRPSDPWDDQAGYQPPGTPRPQGMQDGPNRPSPYGGRQAGNSSGGGRRNRIIAVSAVVVIVAGTGGYLLTHKPGSSNGANSASPTVGASTSASAASTGTAKTKNTGAPKVTGTAAATRAYVLSTPATAGGYPIGSDQDFLATATTTATSIEQSAVSHSGGTVAGKAVSASYTLPDEQAIEFVGYQGTFDPAKVMANLASFGSSEQTFSPGSHGGKMSCANIAATATTSSGAVCVWVTASTLGVTEFFDASGPEALTTAMAKGAADTIGLRSSVETLKS